MGVGRLEFLSDGWRVTNLGRDSESSGVQVTQSTRVFQFFVTRVTVVWGRKVRRGVTLRSGWDWLCVCIGSRGVNRRLQ